MTWRWGRYPVSKAAAALIVAFAAGMGITAGLVVASLYGTDPLNLCTATMLPP